ncbi:MAG: YdcF family protein [Alphaproteobacteria bacterium]|nr:YdcF family protein [Alphaproteobacteria bacterium]
MEILLYYIFWFFINLDLIALGSLILGLFFMVRYRPKIAHAFLVSGALILIFINVSPLGPWMIMNLEKRVQRPSDLPKDEDIGGIILLGGSFSLIETKERGEPVFNKAGTRIYQCMDLARKFSTAKLIATGNAIEGEWSEKIFLDNGFSRERIIIDSDSRTTQDHGPLLKKLIDSSKKYILVTSAFHMPRSLALFKKQGFDVIPYPVDYHAPHHMSRLFWLSSVLQRSTPMAFKQACIEWAGLVGNYVKGLSDEIFPRG